MQQETTTGTRALLALSGIALCAVAGISVLDLAQDPSDPRLRPAKMSSASLPTEGSAAIGAFAPTAAAKVVESEATVCAPASQPSRAAVHDPDASRRETPKVRAVLVAQSVGGLLPAEFVASFEQTLVAQRCRRIDCTDRQALSTMVGAGAEVALLAGELTANQVQSGMRQATLGAELFVLQVAVGSPIRSLVREQVRRIFSGEVCDWRQLGFASGPIVPVVPADPELAARAARLLVPGQRFGAQCRHDLEVLPPGGVRVVRLCDAIARQQQVVRIADVLPSADAYFRGHYPFGMPLQLVTPGQPERRAEELLEFARSDQGRALLGRSLAFAD